MSISGVSIILSMWTWVQSLVTYVGPLACQELFLITELRISSEHTGCDPQTKQNKTKQECECLHQAGIDRVEFYS